MISEDFGLNENLIKEYFFIMLFSHENALKNDLKYKESI